MGNSTKNTVFRLVFYFVGFLIMTFGVAVSIKSGLGVSPVSSVPYTMTVVFGIELGLATTLYSIFAALLQIPILRKKYKPINLLQIPVSVVFGFFMSSCVSLVRYIPDPTNFVVKLVLKDPLSTKNRRPLASKSVTESFPGKDAATYLADE